MKVCSKCHIPKPDDEFYKDRRDKSGLTCACKICRDECKKQYDHTVNGLITSIYSRQKIHSKRRGHTPPEYTKQELITWMLNDEKFETMFSNWKDSGFDKDLRPSTDRLKENIGYRFDNMQLVTWKENYNKNIESVKEKLSIPVYQKDINGKIVNTFDSITEASSITGIKQKNISHTCRGIYTETDGFIWSYKLDQGNNNNYDNNSSHNVPLHNNGFNLFISIVKKILKARVLLLLFIHRINS